MSHKILVYGTLKRGQPNHFIALEPPGSCTFIGQAVTMEKWPMVVAGPYHIPYVLDNQGHGKHIKGEVFVLDDEKLATYDQLERHPDWYTRTPIQIRMITDAEDKSFISEQDPETIELYMMRNPNPDLMQLPMIDNYDSACEPYVLASQRTSGSWTEKDVKASQT